MDNPVIVWLAISFTVGGPLGWLALHRGYPQRAVWVWATMPLGLGPILGLWALLSTRDPLVPWQCPSCEALTAASRHHTIAVADNRTLSGDGPHVTSVVAGSMVASGGVIAGLLAAVTGGAPTLAWILVAAAAVLGAAVAVRGLVRLRALDVPKLLMIGYRCRRCGTSWEVATDPDDGANREGAAVASTTAPGSDLLVESLMTFIVESAPFTVSDQVARWDALRAIARIGGPAAAEALISLLDDPTMVDSALGALSRIRDPRSVPRIGELLEDLAATAMRDGGPDPAAVHHAIAAAEALGHIGDRRAAPILQRIASDTQIDARVAESARHALERLHIDVAA